MTRSMGRESYKLFSSVEIGPMHIANRLVRSATWDPAMVFSRAVDERTLALYAALAQGGAGLIVVGDFNAVPSISHLSPTASYENVRIEGFERLCRTVHRSNPDAKVIAQISAGLPGRGVSPVLSPFTGAAPTPLNEGEINTIVECLVSAIEGVRDDGFDGAQLHAAHSGLLCRFLSPYSNRRKDRYGGTPENRTRLFARTIELARERVGSFPVLIKLNGTDFLEGGIDLATFDRQAALLSDAGFDAIEISGGMREALLRSERELGFRAVPMPESRTGIRERDQQSYFRPYARSLDLPVPVILTGGNLNAELAEEILDAGDADLIGLCRPLIREPDLPRRWLEGRGPATATCLACNACIFDMHAGIQNGHPGYTRCLVDEAPDRLAEAHVWLGSWVDRMRAKADRRNP